MAGRINVNSVVELLRRDVRAGPRWLTTPSDLKSQSVRCRRGPTIRTRPSACWIDSARRAPVHNDDGSPVPLRHSRRHDRADAVHQCPVKPELNLVIRMRKTRHLGSLLAAAILTMSLTLAAGSAAGATAVTATRVGSPSAMIKSVARARSPNRAYLGVRAPCHRLPSAWLVPAWTRPHKDPNPLQKCVAESEILARGTLVHCLLYPRG
jgi:hypothetical protein